MNSLLPRLVVIEGIDAVGKTTIARMLEESLGYVYLYTPQAPFSIIRNLVEEMGDINSRFFYYLASVIAVQTQIRSTLASGKKVVIDSYIYSTMAMHTILGAKIHSVDMRSLPIEWPEIGILLTAHTEVRIKRIESRAKQPMHDKRIDRFTKEGEDAEAIYRSYDDLFLVDTTNLGIEEVFTEVVHLLRSMRC